MMTINIKKGVETGSIILVSDRGLCIAVAKEFNDIEKIFSDIKKEMTDSKSPSGSICLPFGTTAAPKPLRIAFANAGISITYSNKPDTLEYAIDKMEKFEAQVEYQISSYNRRFNEAMEIDSTVTISKKDLFELRVAAAKLSMLEAGGVDNWDWYSDSLNPEDSESFDDITKEIHEEIFGKEKVQNPKIRFSGEQYLSSGSFGAVIHGDFLVLPPEVEPISKQCNIRDAAQLFAIVLQFPTSFAASFGWTQDETKQATDQLREQLRGHIPDNLVDHDPRNAPKHPVNGARPPENAKFKPGDSVP